MNITAREIGRSLVLTLGGDTDGLSPEDAEIAAGDVVRIVVPPVTAEVGLAIWAYYGRILFSLVDESAETEAHRMTRMALGAYSDEDSSEQERARADAQWSRIEALRPAEGIEVSQLALYWNAQGGGLDVVKAMLEDGHPKAQELLLSKNQLWNVYSRLRMLAPSTSSESESETPRPDGSSGTSTPNGSSPPVERDAFGIKRSGSEPSAT